jgi:hypothetical protein
MDKPALGGDIELAIALGKDDTFSAFELLLWGNIYCEWIRVGHCDAW